MNEILVTTQEELDRIPASYDGDIIISEKRKPKSPAVVLDAQKNYRHIILKGYACIEIHKKTSCDAYGHSCVFAYEKSKVELHDFSHGEFYDQSSGTVRNKSSYYSESRGNVTDRRRRFRKEK